MIMQFKKKKIGGNFPFLHTIQTFTLQDITHTILAFSDLDIYIYVLNQYTFTHIDNDYAKFYKSQSSKPKNGQTTNTSKKNVKAK